MFAGNRSENLSPSCYHPCLCFSVDFQHSRAKLSPNEFVFRFCLFTTVFVPITLLDHIRGYMQIYWTLNRVPELAGLSRAERCRVHRVCYSQKFVASGRFFAAMVACGLCAGAGSVLGHYLPSVFGMSYSIWHGAIGAGIGGGFGGWVFTEASMHYLRPFYADYIKRELRKDVA